MKKIVYDKYTSLENCADEPIHLLGNIQPFGALLALDPTTLKIVFCSENISEYTHIRAEVMMELKFELFARLFSPLLSPSAFRGLRNDKSSKEAEFKIHDKEYNVTFHYSGGHFIIELEPLPSGFQKHHDFYDQTSGFIDQINQAQDFKAFASVVAQEIRNIIDYDRVMIYKFDEDFHGEVFAESKSQPLTSFLGLNYPNTDIPEQARELYKKQSIRMLPDVNYVPVPVMAIDDNATHASLDIGKSILRGVSPIHIQYLKNMGVEATLTMSIMIEEQLWGLVACHNYTPKKVLYYDRISAQMQTKFFAAQIRRWEKSEEYQKVQEKEHIYQTIIEEVEKKDNTFESVTSTSYFLGLTDSTGGTVIRNGETHVFGKTPPSEFIHKIQKWMKSSDERIFLSNEFSKHYSEAQKYCDIASGILYFSLDQESDSAVMWFRKELSQGKKWGGRPLQDEEERASTLTPRKSFEAWEEKVSGISAKWYSHEIQAGLRMGSYLEREIYIRNLKKQKEQLEIITNELQATNEELSQFNWISSHDMKEPLRKIRLFIDQIKLEENELNETQQIYFRRIDAAADRMQCLINDLLNYAKLNNEEAFELTSLGDIIETVVDSVKSSEDIPLKIETSDLNVKLPLIDFQIAQLFSNLISNSIKFRMPDRECHIQITAERMERQDAKLLHLDSSREYVKVIYSDNGIGFKESFNEKVFEVFQRLHSSSKFEGTGIGLAICKKIVETHEGSIKAFGKKEKGVRFEIVLPK